MNRYTTLPDGAALATVHLSSKIDSLADIAERANARAMSPGDAGELARLAEEMRDTLDALTEAINRGVYVQTSVEQALSGLSALLAQCRADEVNAQSVAHLIEPQRRRLALSNELISGVL